MTDIPRKVQRVPMTGWVEITQNGQTKTLRCFVNNISREGIGIYAHESVPPGTAVSLTLHFLGRGGLETVKDLRGRVSWSKEHETITILGVQFNQPVDPERHPVLFAFLKDNATT